MAKAFSYRGPVRTNAVRLQSQASFLALLAALAAPTPLIAEEIPTVISPLSSEPDINGVNLLTGRITAPVPILSIPAAPRLSYDRVQNAALYVRGNYTEGPGATANWAVHLGEATSESFTCVDFQCASVNGTGSIIGPNGKRFIQSGTGAIYFFSSLYKLTPPTTTPVSGPGGSGTTYVTTPGEAQWYLSSITYPDGEVITFTYRTEQLPGQTNDYHRPVTISTNLGYHIFLEYGSATLGNVGWDSPIEATIYKTSAPTVPLARLTYAADGTITDLEGRQFKVTNIRNAMSLSVEQDSVARRLPTESSDTFVVTADSTYDMVGTVVRDGVEWDYTYSDVVAINAAIDQYRYSGLVVDGPNNYKATYTFEVGANQTNRLKTSMNALNRITTYGYDPYFRLNKITQPEGNSINIVYDEYGNIISSTRLDKVGQNGIEDNLHVDTANCQQTVGATIVYTACWRPDYYIASHLVGQSGPRTDYAYNTRGQLIQQLDPVDTLNMRRKTVIEYEDFDTGAGIISRRKKVWVCNESAPGPVVDCKTAAELRTEYDYFGATFLPNAVREIAQATTQVHETTTQYDDAGRVLSVNGPRAGADDTQYFQYDNIGRKTWEIGARAPNGLRLAKRFTYRDADDKISLVEAGTVSTVTNPTLTLLESSAVTYDSRRNPIREVSSSGGVTFAVTDKSWLDRGLLECTTVRMNLVALPAATAAGACSVGPEGTQGPDRIEKNSYDNGGQLLKVQKALGVPLLAQDYVTYSYTPNGKQDYVNDARGFRARFTYDSHDRLLNWYFPSETSTNSVNYFDYEQYSYDAAGNRTQLRRRDGRIINFTYDSRNRLMSKLIGDGCTTLQPTNCPDAAATRDVYYTYDFKNRQLTAKFDSTGGADGLTNSYDPFGNLVSSTISMGGFSKTLTAQYDEAGNRTQIKHPDNQIFTYAYDALNRLSGVYEGTGTTVKLDEFTYNDRGLLAVRTQRLGGPVSYTYDGIGRLSRQIDKFVGNVGNLEVNLSYNPASQVVAKSKDNDSYVWRDAIAVNRNYTSNGLNQYKVAGSANFSYDKAGNLISDGTNDYVYDGENRLVSASNGTTLTYDPMGRLWQVTKGTTDTRFLYDGDALVAEYDGSGAMVARYVHGSNAAADDPLVWYPAGSTARWLHADHQGSIVAVSDTNGGAPSINAYDEYGVPAGLLQYGLPGAANTGRFQYTGQVWISELGLYHYKARMYSPTLGRFMQTDPIGYDDQINLYTYVANDPVNKVDPTGKSCRKIGQGFICKVDKTIIPDGKKSLTIKQQSNVKRFEKNYTKTVNKIAQNNKTVRVAETGGRKGTSFETNGSEVSTSLADRSVTYRPGTSDGNALMTTGGNPVTQSVFTNVYDGEMGRSDSDQQADIAHEGIHGTMSERTGNPLRPVLGAKPYRSEHQSPYNDAADDLLEP